MAVRSRGGGLRIWASILAVYALLLHAPAMAAMGVAADGVAVSASGHSHAAETQSVPPDQGDPGHGDPETCCIVCGGGSCAVGPVSAGSVALPLPLARARRLRQAPRRCRPCPRGDLWFEARGPPVGA